MSRNRSRTKPTARPTPTSASALDRPLIVAAVSGAGALGLYLATAAHDIVVGDPTELTVAALTGGVAHPPGYPLLTLLARVFSAIPIDTLAFRVNLVSVVAGAGAAALVALTARRLGAPGPAAVAGAAVFAASSVVWRWSVVIEAFPLNDLLVAAIVLALVAWHARPRSVLPVLAGGALGGLALSNHLTAALLAPAVVVALWQERTALRARPALVPLGALAFGIGLLPYAYVPIASAQDPAWNWGRVASLGDLWTLVSRQSYGATQLVSEGALRGGSAATRVGLLLVSYWPLEALLVLVGAAAAFARARWYFWRTLAAVALAGPLFLAYADIDPARSVSAVILERFFLIAHVITAPLLGLAVAAIADALVTAGRSRAASRIAVGGVIAATVALAASTYPVADRRDDHVARSYGLDILESVDDGVVLVTSGDDASTSVAYLQLVLGLRPDVTHVIAPLLRADWYVRELRDRHAAVAVPFERLGGDATFRALVEANPGRTIATIGGLPDDSLKDTHWLYTRGLVSILRPLPASGSVDDLARENDRLLARYHLPAADQVRGRPWEQAIRGDYARPAFIVGQQFEIAKRYADARGWYQRALAIDPLQQRARDGLARLPRS